MALDGMTQNTLDIVRLFSIYREVVNVLRTLEQSRVVHHDINGDTTLIDDTNHDKVYVTGFSESRGATSPSDAGFRQDLSDLTRVIRGKLQIYNHMPTCDPGLHTFMSRVIQAELPTSEVGIRLQEFADSYDVALFRRMYITKKMVMHRVLDPEDTEAIRLIDFLRAVLPSDRSNAKKAQLIVQKVIRKEHLFELDGEIYCFLEDAEKLQHILRRNDINIFIDLTSPKTREARWY